MFKLVVPVKIVADFLRKPCLTDVVHTTHMNHRNR